MCYCAVIESARRKKSRGFGGGVNVFQFAETVEGDAWDDEKQKQDLEVRLCIDDILHDPYLHARIDKDKYTGSV